jgi:hypothetical protein
MNLSAFFGIVSTVDFALLGLWWITVQSRPELRERGSSANRMAYMVSLQFIIPGTASLLAQVAPNMTPVWRVSFAGAGVTGILAILLIVPALTAFEGQAVIRFLRFGALPLYALITFIAIAPGLLSDSYKLGALQVEAILFCLVIFLGAQVAWAAAMWPEPDKKTTPIPPDSVPMPPELAMRAPAMPPDHAPRTAPMLPNPTPNPVPNPAPRPPAPDSRRGPGPEYVNRGWPVRDDGQHR